MAFTCVDEIVISGGNFEDRSAAAAILIAADYGSEALNANAVESLDDGSLRIIFKSVDTIPEEIARLVAGQFPELDILLVYVSIDGEFCGFLRARGSSVTEGSEDFPEGKREELEGFLAKEALEYARNCFTADLR